MLCCIYCTCKYTCTFTCVQSKYVWLQLLVSSPSPSLPLSLSCGTGSQGGREQWLTYCQASPDTMVHVHVQCIYTHTSTHPTCNVYIYIHVQCICVHNVFLLLVSFSVSSSFLFLQCLISHLARTSLLLQVLYIYTHYDCTCNNPPPQFSRLGTLSFVVCSLVGSFLSFYIYMYLCDSHPHPPPPPPPLSLSLLR